MRGWEQQHGSFGKTSPSQLLVCDFPQSVCVWLYKHECWFFNCISVCVYVCMCFGSGSVGARLSTSTSPPLSRPSPRTSTLKGSTLVPMSTRPPQHVTRLSRFLLWNCVYNVPPNTAGSQCLITVLLWWNYSIMTHKDHICVVSAHLCVFPRRMPSNFTL